ncbi:PH domain-containing protein [Hyphomicrobium sp.]|uniref:PH domain-containing protein n=1 Tax=Hyphomicrobium sp. TaxID=82 RepID=UPI002D771A96|nr:PH domain-containing protein [Hyphomicrobium sp.]HET6388383.1 PH domain-containing protein [Hyphomicrobium sp.]
MSKTETTGDIFEATLFGANVVRRHILNGVPPMLNAGEKVLAVFHGEALTREDYGLGAARKGGWSFHDYLIITDQRVLTWARGLIKSSVDSFALEDISSVEATKGVLLGEITLNIRGAKERFRSMVRADAPVAEKIIRETRQRASTAKSQQFAQQSKADPLEVLERLGGLRDRGIISNEEFSIKKAELLKQIT